MDFAAYLARIGSPVPAGPSLEALRHLHLAHLLAVPFENMDIHLGRPIALGEEALFDKIVRRRRGGFCYELNGLFAALLRSLGFRVTLLSAEAAREDGGYCPPFDHLALRVDLDEPWLADVGFGDGFRLPLPFSGGEVEGYRIVREGGYHVVLQEGRPSFRFTLEPRQMRDFEGMCRYHETSPESMFTRGRLCTLSTPDGRITLSGTRFIETVHGERRERDLAGESEFGALLRERFGIVTA